jgi:transposase-like protein
VAHPFKCRRSMYAYTAMVRLNLPFACPVCGSNEFHQAKYQRADGVTRLTSAYQCAGCSVLFKDADQFTAHRLARSKPPG